jgi:hypothetical protein
MENLPNVRTLENDPQYFGAFLNMARHNVFLLINHLTEKFKDYSFEMLKDDKEINNGINILSKVFDKSNKIPYEEKWRVFNYLENRHHFPILKYYKRKLDVDYKDEGKFNSQDDFFQAISEFLNVAFTELVNFRNSYTHFLAIDNVGNILNRKIDLDIKIKKDITGLFENAPTFSFLRDFQTQKEEDYEHLKKYKIFEDESNELTHQGLYFFICLFLEKKYALRFLKRFKGYKNETIPPFKATLKAFTAYTLKLPNEKIVNENQKQSLLMEMLNELNKCPKELFKHLNDHDKKEFEQKLKDNNKYINIVLNSIKYDELKDSEIDKAIKEMISLKRSEERFSYFALRYLDETEAFKSLRFQITLGKLTINKYNKSVINEHQTRRINKTINVFAKLSDIKDEKSCLKAIKGGNDKDVDFEQYAPHYCINNNKIGFIFNDVTYPKLKFSENINQPLGFISINDLHKLVLMEILSKGKADIIIKHFISKINNDMLDRTKLDEIKNRITYEPNEFTRRIINYKKKDVGEFELSKREDYKKLLEDRRKRLNEELNRYNLDANQFPSKVLDYLMNIKEPDNNKIISNRINQLISEIDKLLNKINKYENDKKDNVKPENKKNEIKIGELATFIARDIVNMVIDGKKVGNEKNTKDKITPPYINKLQNLIAYFSQNKDDIIKLIEELVLFDREKGHIFLTKELIKNSNGIIDFSKKYLQEKRKWIKRNFYDRKYNITLPDKIKLPYTIEKLKKYRKDFHLDKWIKEKNKLPVNLPSTLFDELLDIEFKKKNSRDDKTGISNYLSILLKNDTQPFYGYIRKYNINKVENTFSINNLSSKQINKKYDKNVEANEKLIRFTQTKDRVMKLMCDELIKEDKSLGLNWETFVLKKISPKSDSTPLNSPVCFSKEIRFNYINDKKQKEEVKYLIIAQDTEHSKSEVQKWINLTKSEKEKSPEKKTWYSWTVKDFGRFNKIIYDRRLKNLLQYFEPNEIPFSLLEYELMEYDRIREKIFDNIFDIEKAVCAKDFDGIKKLELQKINRSFNEVQFDIYLKWLKSKNITFDREFIINVRNKFSHSEFPDILFTIIAMKTKNEIEEFEQRNHEKDYKGNNYVSLSQCIYNKYDIEIKKIISEIEKL